MKFAWRDLGKVSRPPWNESWIKRWLRAQNSKDFQRRRYHWAEVWLSLWVRQWRSDFQEAMVGRFDCLELVSGGAFSFQRLCEKLGIFQNAGHSRKWTIKSHINSNNKIIEVIPWSRGFLSPRRDETRERKKRWEKTSGSGRCESHYHATIDVNQHHEIDY